MKKKLLTALFLAGAFVRLDAAPVVLSFANTPFSQINFQGGSFTFDTTPPGVHDFFVTGSSTGNIPSFGLLGDITGTYTIGAVTTVGTKSSAPVNGAGTLTILDGASTFTGALTWIDIYTDGTSGTINAGGTINLTGITYDGTNTDLLALADPTKAIVTSSFTFIPAQALGTLKSAPNGTPISASYSGTIAAVPEPLYSGLLLIGATGILVVFRRRGQSASVSEQA